MSNKNIAMVDLKAIYEDNQPEILAMVKEILESGWYVLGKQVESFEQEFATWLDLPHVISVANGTDAIELALRAVGIKPGDLVATVANTAVATVSAIERAGCRVAFIDIEPATMTMSVDALEKALIASQKNKDPIKALVPVHLYGHMADMPAIMSLAKQYSCYVIEDCAQAHGASLNGKKAGSYGDLAAFSFYPTKNLGAFGDGGAIACKQKELAQQVKMLRQYGWEERNASKIPGVNSRLDELQAGILRVLLKKLDQSIARRQEIASLYQTISNPTITHPVIKKDANHAYHLYVLRTKFRSALMGYLKQHNIQAAIHYPTAIHLQPAYQGRCIIPAELKVTEACVNEILSLPLHPYLREEEIGRMLEVLKEWRV